MEEVDGIIVRNLRSIGCGIDDDINSLGQFSTELIVEAVARCIHVIDSSIEVSYKLPPSMSARFRIGTNLANAVQGLGYRGDVGYHTFLYSNETEIRRVLMFLVDRLPKEPSDASQEPLGSVALLQKSIAAAISCQLALPWLPPFCQKINTAAQQFHSCHLSVPRDLHNLAKPLPKSVTQYYKSTLLPFASCQPVHISDLPAAIMEMNTKSLAFQHEWDTEWNQQGLASRLSKEEYKARKHQKVRQKIADQVRQQLSQVTDDTGSAQDLSSLMASMGSRDASVRSKGSRFAYSEKLQFAQEDDRLLAQLSTGAAVDRTTEADLQKKREDEIESLKAKLGEVTSAGEELEIDLRKMALGTHNMTEQLTSTESDNKKKEEEVLMKKKLIDLLPDAESNMKKLEMLVEASSKRLVSLANQWEKHRIPLLDEYRRLKEVSEDQTSENQRKIEDIKAMQEKMKELIGETRDKDSQYKQLVTEYERMTRDVNRSAYTQRILEIVGNIRKQNEDIDKVLADTKSVQKEINHLSGVLDRTFAVTDELIFKDAKRDEAVRRAYKLLAALHDNCNGLIKSVEETGVITREIRELEEQLETESKKNVEENLGKITGDYQQMRQDNVTLLQRLKKQGVI